MSPLRPGDNGLRMLLLHLALSAALLNLVLLATQ
jgi:hypothetical protein